MSKKRIYIFILVIIFIFSISFWLVISERNSMEKEQQTVSEKKESQSSESLKQVETILYNEENTIKWQLNSEEVANFGNKNFIDLMGLNIDVIDIKEKAASMLYSFTAPAGKYYNNKNILSLKGPIKIEKDSYLLTAGNMQWRQKENTVKGDKGVKITTPSLVLTGSEFISNLKIDSITVSGNENQRAHLYWKENKNESNGQ